MVAPWYLPENHPHYENPPVVETAMSLEYPPVPGFDLYRLMKLQDRWAKEYPSVSDVPGVPPTPTLEEAGKDLVFFGEPPKRLWAAAVDNGLLVQTQFDRLILNWRKSSSDGPYPGYVHTKSEFFRLWGLLAEFLGSTGLPAPIPTMAEFTYVNSIKLASGELPHDVLLVLRAPDAQLPGSERKTRFQFIRSISQSETDPFAAQVLVVGETQLGQDGLSELLFHVIARVLLDAAGTDPAAAVDAAHALATYTFSKIVSPDKRAQWAEL